MANLSDFIGNVVANICESRATADMKTIALAKQYANDELLKHFAIPRFRVDSVELNIPIAINKFQIQNISSAYIKDTIELKKTSLEIIKSSLKLFEFSNDVFSKITEFIIQEIEVSNKNLKPETRKETTTSYANSISQKVINLVVEYFTLLKKRRPSKLELEQIKTSMQNQLFKNFDTKIQTKVETNSTNNLEVIVDSFKLKEIPAADKIMINMKISEQGMEWIKVEDAEGNSQTKLMPE